MKKLFSLFLALVATTALWAHDFQVDGIYYNILADKTNEVEVTYRGSHGSEYNEYSGSVTIPSTVTYYGTTYSVTSIGYQAFYNCYSLTSITIPNSVTTIGNHAFLGCSGLTSVTIPNSVTSIGERAFYYCSSLTSITIPNSVTSIGSYAFLGCSGLTSVTIPNSVTSIGSMAFYNCSSLTSVVWNAENCADLFSESAPFNDIHSQITSFTFGDSVKNIPAYLCYGMSNLTSITIPNSVTSIGASAFERCYSLTSITLPDGLTSIGNSAFYECSRLTSITIPNSVTSIGYRAFLGCSGLTSVTIPNSVTSIGDEAFCFCSGLTSVTIPNSVTSIGYRAFYNCYSLTSITLPNSVTSIGDEAFRECSGLTSITIPNSVTSIGYSAFRGCASLTSVVWNAENCADFFSESAPFNDIHSQITSFTFGDKVKYIPRYLCYWLINLTSVTIPATVEEIDNRAFENCRSLKSVIFEGADTPQGAAQYASGSGSSLWRIGNGAFYNCHQLEHLVIPEGVTEIGDAAFYDCTNLEDMTLPSTVQEIGDNGFALCAQLEIMYVKAFTPPTIQAKTFLDVNRKIPVYVPDGAVDAYKDDPYWSEFKILSEENAVENVINPTSSTQKLIRNGHLLIIRDGVEYNAMGVEIQ